MGSGIWTSTGRSSPPPQAPGIGRLLRCPARFCAPILWADTQEPFFLQNAARWADALRDAGADVMMTERAGGHGETGRQR